MKRIRYFFKEVIRYKVLKLESSSTWHFGVMQKKHWSLRRFWQNSKGAGSR